MKKHGIVKHVGTGLLLGGIAGLVTGTVITLYKLCAKHVVHLAETLYHHFREQPLWLIPAVAALVVLALTLALIYRRTSNLRGGGIPTAIGMLRGWIPFQWVRNAIGVFVLSLTSFLAGVPLGTEGPSVQLGTTLGDGCSRLLGKRGKAWSRYGMTGGACAGFSTATGAPLSGILFAVEEAHNRVSPLILIVAASAVAVARLVSDLLAPILDVSSTLFPAMELRTLKVEDLWIPVALGVMMGLFAVLFLSFYRSMSGLLNHKLAKVPHFYKIFAFLLLTLGFGWSSFAYVSTGHELILHLFGGETIVLLIIILLVRTTLTVGANVTGITGGIFLPLMAIGATVASLFAEAATACGLDESYYAVILVLGITACIAGMMKMPLTAIAFAVEALSGANIILPVLLVAGVAYGLTEWLGAVSINDRVLDGRMEKIHEGRTVVTADTTVTVQSGSFADGKEIRDILWPNGLFVLSVDAKSGHGGHHLNAGDCLHVRYSTRFENRLKKELFHIVGEQEKE